jgi:predicted transcriptional regulator
MAKQKTMSFQIDPAIRLILDKQAEIQDRSISWLINHYLRQALEAEGLLSPKKDGKNKT